MTVTGIHCTIVFAKMDAPEDDARHTRSRTIPSCKLRKVDPFLVYISLNVRKEEISEKLCCSVGMARHRACKSLAGDKWGRVIRENH